MQSSTTSKTTEGYNIYSSKLEVWATSKSRNDRDDTCLPGQSPKVPLQSWGIHLQPTGPESSFILWSRKSSLPILAQFIGHFSLKGVWQFSLWSRNLKDHLGLLCQSSEVTFLWVLHILFKQHIVKQAIQQQFLVQRLTVATKKINFM